MQVSHQFCAGLFWLSRDGYAFLEQVKFEESKKAHLQRGFKYTRSRSVAMLTVFQLEITFEILPLPKEISQCGMKRHDPGREPGIISRITFQRGTESKTHSGLIVHLFMPYFQTTLDDASPESSITWACPFPNAAVIISDRSWR